MFERKATITGVVLIFVAGLLGSAVRAQADETFFAGGGPSVRALVLDLSALNVHLPGRGFTGDFKLGENSVFFMSGGGGFIGDNLRVGGVGAERSWTAPVDDPNFDRVELSFQYNGLLIESLRATKRGGVSVGGVFGSGKISLGLSKVRSGSFDEIIKQPSSLELSREFFIVQPYLSTEFKLLEFVGLKLEVGFLFGLGQDDWKFADGSKVPGGPLSTISAPMLSIMLVLGG